MHILGINAGHNATACLLVNGKIRGCVSEERFSRIKNHAGFPSQAINYLLNSEGISSSKLDLVVLDNNLKKNPHFGQKMLDAYLQKDFKKKAFSYIGYKFPDLFRKYLPIKRFFTHSKKMKTLAETRKFVSETLDVPLEKIEIFNHHLLHASALCFNLPRNQKTLIFTLDGEGDELCATVSLYDGDSIQTIARTDKFSSLGYLYSLATIHLGMKPLQHEFKVMGLAPYAKKHAVDKTYDLFRKIISIDENLSFQSKFNLPFADHFFNRELKFVRFDAIAGAIQRITEDLSTEWVAKAITKTGVHNVALAGGVFMNVKVNQKISELSDVNSLFVMPSCGDESNAIGAAFQGYKQYCSQKNIQTSPKMLEHLYLGPEYNDAYLQGLIKRENLKSKYFIKKPSNINYSVAKLLSEGKIVARCSGKSEWGARALGNRSILANPNDKETIRILNETIKDRDFWMPFTPSMLDSYEKKYIKNPKKIRADFMTITFPSTSKAQKDLPAAMHPYDFSVRPQIVRKKYNRDYHEILSNFKELTGTAALLNTSFNLHGEPNVLTPEDALRTVENSDLTYLAMGSYLFTKK